MKSFLLIFILGSLLVGCGVRYPQQTGPADPFKDKYADKLEPGSTLVDWGYIYTFEKTADGKYIYKQYYPETRKMVLYTTYLDKSRNVADGLHKAWWDDGTKVSEGHYRNDQLDGEWENWNEKNKSVGKYVNGKQEGVWIGYDSLGQKRSELSLSEGKRNGPFKDWNANGELTREGSYLDDKLVSEQVYSPKTVAPDELFNAVEKRPCFSGCTDGPEEERKKCCETQLLQFIYSNIKYPPFARENNVEGTAYVQFVVEKDGSVSNIKTLRGVCRDIKNECERVVRKMPKWEPGEQKGEPVRVKFTLPVKFKLE